MTDLSNLAIEPSADLNQNKLASTEALSECSSIKRTSNKILCSSLPLYKLWANSSDVEVNNPFDHFERQAGLFDDPFEIAENAALILANSVVATTVATIVSEVPEDATLISFDSMVSEAPRNVLSANAQAHQLTVIPNTSQEHKMTVFANVSQKSTSSSPLCASNSHLDSIAADDVKSGEANDKQKHDDSFDDIWSTSLSNLVDSQAEFDVESDTDSDIAKLNIPMLNIPIPNSQSEENLIVDPVNGDHSESLSRSKILEQLASIKQNSPSLPLPLKLSPTETVPINHKNGCELIKGGSQLRGSFIEEATTPLTQNLSIVPVHHQQENVTSNNPDALIKKLQTLVHQCDDKRKKMAAKYLLNDLSSILTKTIPLKSTTKNQTIRKNRTCNNQQR